MDDSHPVRWTYILIGFIVFIFVLQNLTTTWGIFVFYPAYAFKYPWMFITSIFFHAGVDHILVNMLVFFYFGTYLERSIGSKRLLLVFFLAGIIGNFGYLITSTNPYVPALGASGAIYGVMGTLAVLEPFLIVYIGFIVPVPMILAMLGYAALDLAGLFAPSDVAHGAHIAGLAVGVLFGLYLRSRVKNRDVRALN